MPASLARPRTAPPGGQRTLIAPPRTTSRPSRWRRGMWLLVGLPVLLLGGVLLGVAQQPTAAAEPPPPTLPLPPADEGCVPGLVCETVPPSAPSTQVPWPPEPEPLPTCDPSLPLVPCQPSGTPGPTSTTTRPCEGDDCIPQPIPPPEDGGPPPGGPGGGGEPQQEECGLFHLGGCFTNAINGFFRGIVTVALNPLLDLLSNSLLTTPTLEDLPQILNLWSTSWYILLACYGLLVLAGGIVVMSHETLQTRYSVKEILPRMAVGFLAGALSLFVANKAIGLANGLSEAVLGGGVDPDSAGNTLKDMVHQSLTGGLWIFLLAIFLIGVIIALLVTYIVRVALIVILLAGAPLALMFHALPQTEAVARWWWKALGALLAVQVLQSLTLVTGLRIFLAPGGFNVFGVTGSGLVNILVCLALMFILFRIPSWLLSAVRVGGGRSFVGGLAKAYVAGKALGAVSGRRHHASRTGTSRQQGERRVGSATVSAGQGTAVQTGAGGLHVLSTGGLRHTSTARTRRQALAARDGRRQGRSLGPPMEEARPAKLPVMGRDGTYRPRPGAQRTRPRQSLGVPAVVGSPPVVRRGGVGRQREAPPMQVQGNRSAGSRPSPLPSTELTRASTTAPVATSTSAVAPTPAGPRPRPGGQLRLPLDLPKRPTPRQGGRTS